MKHYPGAILKKALNISEGKKSLFTQPVRVVVLSMAAVLVLGAAPVHAQGLSGLFGGGGSSSGDCGETKTHLVACDGETGVAAIGDLIRIATIVMTILIGVVATGAIGYAAILYASARDDREKVSSALTIIRNVVIGLLMYVFTVAIIGWLIPASVIETPPPSESPSPTPSTSPTPSGSVPPGQ